MSIPTTDDLPLWRADALSQQPDLAHGFTTRDGGVSRGARASLHLALKPGDDPVDITENWRRVVSALGASLDQLVLLDQVHGSRVVEVDVGTGPLATAAAADGVVSTRPGLVLAVRTADCVPVLFAAPGGVGAAHAGWRGVVAGVVPETVRALMRATGCSPDQISVAIGPHASVERYEVGREVVDALEAAGLQRGRVSRMGPRGREHADLRAAVHEQLTAAGVHHIGDVHGCTLDHPALFSHRRDGALTGRQAGVIRWSG